MSGDAGVTEPVVRSTGLTKRFGDVVAVDDVSLALQRGEILSILGPSGCGKTTLLRLIAGFELPDAGEIEIQGRVVSGRSGQVPPDRRGVGMVFQEYALFPHRTVAQNVSFGLQRLSGGGEAQPSGGSAGARQAHGTGGEVPSRAVRGAAAAGRSRQGARTQTGSHPARRALQQFGCGYAPGDALGGRADPEGARNGDHIRHPRPGRRPTQWRTGSA